MGKREPQHAAQPGPEAAAQYIPRSNLGDSKTDALHPGSPAPDFDLPADGGGRARLKDYAGRTVVLYFYPKDDIAGCTKEAADFTDQAQAFAAAGAVVIGMSKDSVASHDKFKAKYGLAPRLASDATAP